MNLMNALPASYRLRDLSRRQVITVMLTLSMAWSSVVSGTMAADNRSTTGQDVVSLRTWSQPLPEALPNLLRWTDTCNVYALIDGDSALLFNCGDGSVRTALKDRNVKHLDWILMTDHHREVSQGLEQPELQSAQLAVPDGERELFANPQQFRRWYPKLGDKYSVYGASYVRPPRLPVQIDRTLTSDETFEWHGFSIRCVATPGHSPGGMTFVLKANETTVAVTGGLMHDGSRMVNWFDTEWDYGFAKGVDTLLDSVRKVAELKPDVALPTQGPVIENATAQLEAYHQKLTEFREQYIRGYPVFDKSTEKRDPLSKPTAVAHINQVTPHIYKLSHLTQGKNFAIIISDRGHGLVLDCGLFPETMLDEIIVGLRQHMGLKQIDAFWISHMHGDHFLLGPVMKEKYGAQAWTMKSVVDRCENPRNYDYAALVSAYGDGFDGMKIDRAIDDGEVLEWEGYKIHVDWMPGQTEFACCLWLDIDGQRVAFTGDNLFGSPSDEEQNGHEAVVARNSAILEEGYVTGSRYLLNLNPDLIMGSHSYVMPQPRPFLERYHKWSQHMVELYQGLLPDSDYEYLFDPYWVSAYPYRVDLTKNDSQTIQVTVRNFRSMKQQHRIELVLPMGVQATPSVLEGTVDAESRGVFPVTITADRSHTASGVQMVPLDITLDGRPKGQLFDFLLQVRPNAGEPEKQ
ncbi:MAG: MBL fold metallo-hydrolase [Planctomycetaceae bacterium]|nr:MBL fold metallo-hydrolase [Planctomycetaceae bacterium]